MRLLGIPAQLPASDRIVKAFWLAIVPLATALYLFAMPQRTWPELVYGILLGGLIYAVLTLFVRSRPRFTSLRAGVLSSIVKGVLGGLVLYTTGGLHSPFADALYFSIVAVAFRCDFWTTVLTGAFYALVYAGVAGLTGDLSTSAAEVIARVAFLMMTAGVAAVMSEQTIRLRVEEHARQHVLKRVLMAQDSERQRIARELHDETGQSLASLIVGLRALEEGCEDPSTGSKLRRLRGVAENTADEVSRLSRGLHPSSLDALGFVAAAERLAAEVKTSHGIEAGLIVHGFERSRADLPPEVALALYRILQEALTNVVRHAAATSVTVRLDRSGGRVRAAIEDDGCGFDANSAVRGIGLHSIRERVTLLGGTLGIDSAPGRGTVIEVQLPVSESPT